MSISVCWPIITTRIYDTHPDWSTNLEQSFSFFYYWLQQWST